MPRFFRSPFLGACALFFGLLSGGFASVLCFGADRPGPAASLSQVVDPETVRDSVNTAELLRQWGFPVGDSHTVTKAPRTWMAPRRSEVSDPVSPEVRDTVDAVFEPACTLEGIVRLKPASEPEGVARLRELPYVGRMVGWFFPVAAPALVRRELEVIDLDAGRVRMRQGANVLTADSITICRNPEGRCAAETAGELLQAEGPITSLRQLRNRMMQQIAGVAPTASEAPPVRQRAVDVGAVEDLVFPDPETGKRVIQAAGQGFRVVVLTPVADPHPIQDSLDCPRPLPIFQEAGMERHPEPTPSLAEVEGRVRMSAVPQPEDVPSHATGLARRPGSAPGFHKDRNAPSAWQNPATVPARPGHADRSQDSISAVEHLRLAARKLQEQGIPDAARQIERQADDLDQMVQHKLEEVHRQIARLHEEARRLEALGGRPQQIMLRTQIIEFDRTRLQTAAGQRFLKAHRQPGASAESNLSKEIATLSSSSRFLEEATRQGFSKTLAMPTLVTLMGEPACVLTGGEFPVPNPHGAPTFRSFGVSLIATPRNLGGNRLRLQLINELSERDMRHAVNIGGAIVPGLNVRRLNTEVDLNHGETAVVGGIQARFAPVPAAKILPASAEEEQTESSEREVLFLVTPELIPEATWPTPPLPGTPVTE